MKDFAIVTNASGAFPDVEAVDNVTPGLGTGLEATWVSDLWRASQVILEASNQTPDGSMEASGTSQILEALRRCFSHPGELVAWFGPSIPADARMLPLEGQDIVIADYPELVAATYCGDPANPTAPAFYKNNFGVRNTAGVHFRLPDARGYFLRGIAADTTIDPQGVRLPGSAQLESIGGHEHAVLEAGAQEYQPAAALEGTGAATIRIAATGAGTSMNVGNTGTGIGTGTANETRSDNIAVQWCIRY